MPRVCIIGLGQPAAGDDGVGPAVVEALALLPLPEDVALATTSDASLLVDLLASCGHAVVVDAAVGAGPPGSVHVLEPAGLAMFSGHPLSSHGIGVAQALELARAVLGHAAPRVSIVAIGIEAPRRPVSGLSRVVQAAIPQVQKVVLELAFAPQDREFSTEHA